MNTDIKTELSESTDVCTISDIGLEICGDDAQPLIDAVNAYLECFAKPTTNGKKSSRVSDNKICLKCGEILSGFIGTFQWGIVHGEGTCSNCGWPARAYHNPADDEGNIFSKPLEIVLQYHPKCVKSQDDEEIARLLK